MKPALIIKHYRSFLVCDTRETRLEQQLDIASEELRVGESFPGWPLADKYPQVSYYDGECLELDYDGEHYALRTQEGELELDAYPFGEGPKADQRIFFHLSLPHVGTPTQLPPWAEMRRRGSLNALVCGLLPLLGKREEANRQWLRLFSYFAYSYLLSEESLEAIRRAAEEGNPWAQFAYGRSLMVLAREANFGRKALGWLEQARRGGVADASVALGLLWESGDAGEVDRTQADNYYEEALEKGCDYAWDLRLRDLTYGSRSVEANPQKAVELATMLIERDEKEGLEANPMWYFRRACAVELQEGTEAAVSDFKRAVGLGAQQALPTLLFHYGCDEEGEVKDRAAYLHWLCEGCSCRDYLCSFFMAQEGVRDWSTMPVYGRMMSLKRYLMALKEAVRLGSLEAADRLGDIFRDGDYDVEVDFDEAAKWYRLGMRMGSEYGCESLYDLLEAGEERDRVALKGARLGSRRMMFEALDAYQEGRLQEFAVEIDRYYMPFYEELCEEFYEEDYPDDGRYDPYV